MVGWKKFVFAFLLIFSWKIWASEAVVKVTPGCARLVTAFAGFGGVAAASAMRGVGATAEAVEASIARSAVASPAEASTLISVSPEMFARAHDAFDVVFRKLYGEGLTCDSLSASVDPLTRKMRCIWSLFYDRRNIPRQISIGLEHRLAARNDRIAKVKKEIGDLRAALGARAEYLTPAALAAVEIFADLGRSRNLSGGGVREALKQIARPVRDNLDTLFFTTSNAAGADDALMELLIFVSGLIYNGTIDPVRDPGLRAACEDLIISSFSPLGEPLLPATIAKFEDVATSNWMIENGIGKPFLDHVVRVSDWQKRLSDSMASFATTYYKGRTAYSVLSLMTRPNGYNGIPLGSALRDALPSFDGHPDTLRLAILAHGSEKKYLSLGIGELLEIDTEIRDLVSGENALRVADRMLVPYLIGDLQLYAAFLQGYEFELRAARDLLKMEKKGVLAKWFANLFGSLSGGITRQMLTRSKMVQQILPGKFVDALVQQAEVGMDPTVTEASKVRKREVRTLPRNLPSYLIEDRDLIPWEDKFESFAVASAAVIAQGGGASEKKEKHDPDADPDGTALGPAPAPAIPAKVPEALTISVLSRDGVAENYLWKILKKLERKAQSLLAQDANLQRQAELGRTKIAPKDIAHLAEDVRVLLTATLDVLTSVESCFLANNLSFEDAEETFARHLIKKAPTVAMYVVGGPPGVSHYNPAQLTGLSGLSWRIVMLTPRLAYGDGMPDEPIFITAQTDPHHRYYAIRRNLAIAALSAASAYGVPWAVRKGVDYLGWEIPYVSSPKEEAKGAPPVTPPKP